MDKIDIIVDKAKLAVKASTMNVDEVPLNVRAAWTMRKNQSVEELKNLRSSYGGLIAKAVTPVFADDVEPSVDTLVFDANQFYVDMGKSIPNFVKGRFDVNNIAHMRNFMLENALELGIMEFDAIDYSRLFAVATDAQGLPVHLKELFEKAHIDYFADRYLSKSILDKLFERKDTKETLPNVVIKNVKPNKVSTISRMFSGTYTKSIGTEQSPNIEPSTENQVDMSSPKSSNKSKRKNKNGQ